MWAGLSGEIDMRDCKQARRSRGKGELLFYGRRVRGKGVKGDGWVVGWWGEIVGLDLHFLASGHKTRFLFQSDSLNKSKP